jgi:hypothetical protein
VQEEREIRSEWHVQFEGPDVPWWYISVGHIISRTVLLSPSESFFFIGMVEDRPKVIISSKTFSSQVPAQLPLPLQPCGINCIGNAHSRNCIARSRFLQGP